MVTFARALVNGCGTGCLANAYMLFICLAAIISAGLNLVGRFAVAASTPILLNLAMIGALVAGLTGFGCRAIGLLVVWWRFSLVDYFSYSCQRSRTSRMAPTTGVGGRGSVDRALANSSTRVDGGGNFLQINILISQLLAYSLDESAVSCCIYTWVNGATARHIHYRGDSCIFRS